MTFSKVSVTVIGGGPAGIAAAIAAARDGVSVLLVEREKRLGGMLLQSIQDGFGLLRYDNTVTGPEYAFKDISVLNQTNAIILLQTTVTDIVSIDNTFQLTLSNRHGVSIVESNSIVLATGCRELTPYDAGVYGSCPSGVFTAGMAQHYLNVSGQLPVRSCVMLGSSNLGLATARSLTLSGVKVIGVFEPNAAPRGSLFNVSRCLFDFYTQLHLNHTVTRAFGSGRLRAVEIARTSADGKPIRGSERAVQCDGLIVATGFMPENNLADLLTVPSDERTNGPLCDQNRMTMKDGVFVCGNALHISDLVDYVSEDGEIAGRCAARHIAHDRALAKISTGNDFLTVTPQYIDCNMLRGSVVMFLNSSETRFDATVRVFADNNEVFSHKFEKLCPAETQRIEVSFPGTLTSDSEVVLSVS